MINNFLMVLSLSGIALGVMACCILLFSNKRYKYVNRLLAVALICMISILLVTFLFVWNIDFYAYVYRFPSPLLYLLLPVSFLYIRAIVNEETHLNKIDSIHFFLPVFYFIEILPHYFSSYNYRLTIVREFAKHPEKFIDLSVGVLPSFYNTMLLIVQGAIYIILIVTLLKKANRIKEGDLYTKKATSFGWIKIFTVLIGINFLPMLCFFLCPVSFLNYALQLILIMLTLSFLVITLYLFTKPEILYGIHKNMTVFPEKIEAVANEHCNTVQNNHSPEVITCEMVGKKSEFSNLERYKPLVESYMHSQKPFLRKGYTINDLSNETRIPQHHLSAMINRVYEMRFNEYLNRLRIDYISENLKNPEWEKLTLEGIAKQAGFTSRTTFFNSLKKTRGLSPSEYITQIKQKI